MDFVITKTLINYIEYIFAGNSLTLPWYNNDKLID